MKLPPIWARIPVTIVFVYVAWSGLACSLQNKVVFPGPAQATGRAPAPVPYGGERLTLDLEDGGVVEGWFLPGAGVSADKPGPAVLFAHGNAETIDEWAFLVDDYLPWGVSVLLMEYRGYGRSGGVATQQAVIRDGVAFYDLLVARPDVDKERIVLHGRSIGTGVACAVSRARPARLMVLQSAFSDLGRLGWQFGVPPFVVEDRFENTAAVAAFPGPVLLFHGRHDPLFSFDHAERLAAASPRVRLQPMDCEHNDCPMQLIMTVVRESLGDAGVTVGVTEAQRHERRFLRPKEGLR